MHEAAPTLPKDREFSENVHDFLARCLERDPGKRSGPSELLLHPFLQQKKTKEELKDYFDTVIVDEDMHVVPSPLYTPTDDFHLVIPTPVKQRPVFLEENPTLAEFNKRTIPIDTNIGETETDYMVYIRSVPGVTFSITAEDSRTIIVNGVLDRFYLDPKYDEGPISFSQVVRLEKEINLQKIHVIKGRASLTLTISKFSKYLISQDIKFR